MKKRIKEKWCKALESGEYAPNKKRDLLAEKGRKFDKFSAFGVLCDLHAIEKGNGWADDYSYLYSVYLPPTEVKKWAGLSEVDINRILMKYTKHFKSFVKILKTL